MAKTTFIAAGDCFITRRLPRDGYEGFSRLQALIAGHDVAFLNLESTFHDTEGYPAAESGGTWAMSDPRTLDDIKTFGFNLFTTANNHSGDYGEGGILATVAHLKERDMVFAGTGENLAEAEKPCYLETKNARVALIGCDSGIKKAPHAAHATKSCPGRPGLNPMTYQEIYHLDQAHFDMAQSLVKVSTINRNQEKYIRNGYGNPVPEGVLPFGNATFKLDEKNWVENIPNKKDMARMEAQIREAKRQADVVLVTIHNHYLDGYDNTVAPAFLETFAHNCIDAGADAVIGHGPHELQGIEIYGGKPIFYSIGNFLFQTETVALQPWDAFHNRGMDIDTPVGEYMSDRSKNDTVGYNVQWPIWNSVLPAWTMEDGKLTRLELYPIELGMEKKRSQKGVPVLNDSAQTLKYLEKISARYGTKIQIKDGVGYIEI